MINEKEINKIKSQYEEKPKSQTELDKLKELDRQAKRPVQAFSYVLGTAGALVLGTGMTMAMALIPGGMAAGVIIGSAGIATAGANYPLHKRLMSKRKKKYSKKIVAMSDAILGADKK